MNNLQVAQFLFKVFGKKRFNDCRLYFRINNETSLTRILQVDMHGLKFSGGNDLSHEYEIYIRSVNTRRVRRRLITVLDLEF